MIRGQDFLIKATPDQCRYALAREKASVFLYAARCNAVDGAFQAASIEHACKGDCDSVRTGAPEAAIQE